MAKKTMIRNLFSSKQDKLSMAHYAASHLILLIDWWNII